MGTASDDRHRLPPPVLADGTVYAAWWVYATVFRHQQLWLFALDAATGVGTQTKIDQSLTPVPGNASADPQGWFDAESLGQYPPLLLRVPDGAGAAPGQTRQVLYVNGGNAIWGVDVAAPNPPLAYHLPDVDGMISSGLSAGAGGLWCGDHSGTLYGLDYTLKLLPHTPAHLLTSPPGSQSNPILTTPVVYAPAGGQPAVLLAVADPLEQVSARLLAFDPAVATSSPPLPG